LGGCAEIAENSNLEMARFDLKYSDVRILKFFFATLSRIYIQDKKRKAHLYESTFFTSLHKLQQISATEHNESSGFLGKCAEHVVRRTVLAVAL